MTGADFYTVLGDSYDDIFPLEPAILRFLEEEFQDAQRILDIACGTGTYTMALAKAGKTIYGIDLSETMIKKAREKAPQWTDHFLVDDMLTLSNLPEKNFQGVYCIGNSLVHIDTLADIGKALRRFREVLEPRGILTIQIINFDRIRFDKESPFLLPPLQGKRVKMTRTYSPGTDPGRVYFDTELILSQEEPPISIKNRVPLVAVQSTQIKNLLTKAGFTKIRFYGSYDKSPYKPDASFLTIAVAEA
jgi:2-polyprenyl-3-methyl-5-hydroxy-6-metoxy-1,4-benzoquinol methylase